MEPTPHPRTGNGITLSRVKWHLLLVGLLFSTIPLHGQKAKDSILPGVTSRIEDNDLDRSDGDTSSFHILYLRFQAEKEKRGFLDLDTFRHYGHLAIHECRSQQYFKGLIRTFIGFGWGYVEKNEIDSSLYYYNLASIYASALNDTALLAEAYFNGGWALLYQYRNQESIETALKAYRLAKASNDTSLLIQVTSKLGRIYMLTGQSLNSYGAFSESIQLCKIKHDTNSLIRNYFLFGILCNSTSLLNKHRRIVYDALAYKDHLSDTEARYNLHYLAANWYDRQEQYDSMLYHGRKLIGLSKELNRIPMCMGRMAKAFIEKDQLDSAKYYLSILMKEKIAYKTFIDPHDYMDIGEIEFRLGNLTDAFTYFRKAEEQLDKTYMSAKQRTYKGLYNYYDAKQQDALAYSYLKKYTLVSDSILEFQNNLKEGISVLELESNNLETENTLLAKNFDLQIALTKNQRQQKSVIYVSSFFLFVLSALAFMRFKKQKELKGKQALMSERLRISRELHDEIGATLSGIAMYSHVAKEQVKHANLPEAEHSLSFMQKSAGEMVNKLSDIVWLINPEQDTILEIIGRLGEYGKQMAGAKNMQMKLDVPFELTGIHIPLEARRNIYLICKEAINNAVKYSHGRLVELNVTMIGAQMVFSVLDDGNGFDETSVKQGNGLANMRKRAENIGATFHVQSPPYEGSRIDLHYKLIH